MSVDTAILSMLDRMDAGYFTADAAARQTAWDGMTDDLTGSGDLAFIRAMINAVPSAQQTTDPDRDNYPPVQILCQALDNAYLAKQGYANVDAWLTAKNATPFTMLIGPKAAYLYWLFRSNGSAYKGNKTGSLLLNPSGVFAPVTTLATASIGAAGAVTFTAGSTIPTANDAESKVQGYAPSVGITATATTAINGTESIHVTYKGQSSTGTPFTGHVGTLVVDNLALNATTLASAWTPQATGERISQITAMAVTGTPTATAGAIRIDSVTERVMS